MARPREYVVYLTPAERKFLARIKRSGKTCRDIKCRCPVLLEADESKGRGKRTSREQIASHCGVAVATVTNTIRSFCTGGVASVLKIKRNENSNNGARKTDGADEARIIAKACSPAPGDRSRWTVRLLAEESAAILEHAISPSTVSRILRKNEIRPHMSEYWCIPPSENADFVAAMEDVLEVYQRPPDPEHPVWCMDEKPFQILGENRDPLPMRKGDIGKIDSEYVRNGTVSIFCFIQPLTGRIHQSVQPTRTAVDWANQIKWLVDEAEPDAEKIILVMDNLNTHKPGSLYAAFPPAEARRILSKLEIHYTPVHGSWLDIAEIGINIMTRQCLGRRFGSIDKLACELDKWEEDYGKDHGPVNWQFTASDARAKLVHLYPDLEMHRKKRDERAEAKGPGGNRTAKSDEDAEFDESAKEEE